MAAVGLRTARKKVEDLQAGLVELSQIQAQVHSSLCDLNNSISELEYIWRVLSTQSKNRVPDGHAPATQLTTRPVAHQTSDRPNRHIHDVCIPQLQAG